MVLRRLIIGISNLYNTTPIARNRTIYTCPCRNNVLFAKAKNNFDNDSNFKQKLISQLNFKSKEDAQPFYKLNDRTLIHINKITENDVNNGYCENRLYYISSRIKCPPSVLSEKLAKRIFVYELSFDWLENSLNVLLEMGVPGDRILRDLWVLKYYHITIKERLQQVKDAGIDHLHPWMVRCTPHILNKYIKLSKDTKDILGDSKSSEEYLAERLDTSVEVVRDMYIKLPALKTIRVPKLKAFLDFLIGEGFSVEEIRNKPRILAASQQTVKQRLYKLREMGLQNINLNILCRSKKDFQKFVDSLTNLKDSEMPTSAKSITESKPNHVI